MSKIAYPGNEEIAKMLADIAHLLELQHADQFRIFAYQKASQLVLHSEKEMAELLRTGSSAAIEDIHGIGPGIARIIVEYLKTGKSTLLNRLRGSINPEDLFEAIPGIGKDLAKNIVNTLHVHNLAELEQAAHDGRLDTVPGFGKKRTEAIKMILAGMQKGFPRQRIELVVEKEDKEPGVELLLSVDKSYREKAKQDKLKKIAPRRFNPENKAWLPILHYHEEGWSFTALFSNTWRAHELKKTKDWVIIFFEKGLHEGQVTVVTEKTGQLKGKRVIRGKENLCAKFYQQKKTSIA